MTRCPHCHKLSNPLQLLIYRRSKGYQCRECGGRSEFRLSALRWLGGALGGLGGYFGASLSRQYGWWPGIGYILAAVVCIMFIGLVWQFLFFSLIPKCESSNSATLPWGTEDAPEMQVRSASPSSLLIKSEKEVEQVGAGDAEEAV